MGLQSLIEEILPEVTVRCFPSFDALMEDTPFYYVHYFVSANIYFEHTAFFREQGRKTILLVQNKEQALKAGIPFIDVTQNETHIVQQMLYLRQMAVQAGAPPMAHSDIAGGYRPDIVDSRSLHIAQNPQMQPDLSLREIEVLVLLVKGMINKEIADHLNISVSTVITHRKNIQEKTGFKSLAGLTVYAILNGHITVDEI